MFWFLFHQWVSLVKCCCCRFFSLSRLLRGNQRPSNLNNTSENFRSFIVSTSFVFNALLFMCSRKSGNTTVYKHTRKHKTNISLGPECVFINRNDLFVDTMVMHWRRNIDRSGFSSFDSSIPFTVNYTKYGTLLRFRRDDDVNGDGDDDQEDDVDLIHTKATNDFTCEIDFP